MAATWRERFWRRPRLSLKALLLCMLLPGMLASLALDSYSDHQTLVAITRDAFDDTLRLPLSALAGSVTMGRAGYLELDTEAIAQNVVEPDWSEPVYYQIWRLDADPVADPAIAVATARVVLGRLDLPLPPDWAAAAAPGILFYDASLAGEPVRVAAQFRRLKAPGGDIHVLVQAAQSHVRRRQAEAAAWRQESWRDLRAVAVLAFLLWLGLGWGLRPLARLRAEVSARRPDDTTSLDATTVPSEVAPLVYAINHHIARHRAIVDEQSQFLTDASHQLRTPLTILLTQAEYALRENNPDSMRESLRAMIDRLSKTRRLTVQLLNLAIARHVPATSETVFDLAGCGRDVLIEYLPMADERRIDLGWDDGSPEEVSALGRPDGIREAIVNLLHNALQYTPAGGSITMACGSDAGRAWLSVSDDGPGVPADQRDAAFTRFERLDGANRGQDSGGSGLGLAIARAFASRDGGDITLHDGEVNALGGRGLRAVLTLASPCVAVQHKS